MAVLVGDEVDVVGEPPGFFVEVDPGGVEDGPVCEQFDELVELVGFARSEGLQGFGLQRNGDRDSAASGDAGGAFEEVEGVELDGLVGLQCGWCAEVGEEGDVEGAVQVVVEHQQVGDQRVEVFAGAVSEGDDDGQCALVDPQDLADL